MSRYNLTVSTENVYNLFSVPNATPGIIKEILNLLGNSPEDHYRILQDNAVLYLEDCVVNLDRVKEPTKKGEPKKVEESENKGEPKYAAYINPRNESVIAFKDEFKVVDNGVMVTDKDKEWDSFIPWSRVLEVVYDWHRND